MLSLDLLKKAEAERETKEKAAAQQSAGGFTVVSEDGTADEGIENLIRQRAEAKKAKNFAEADRIRDELKAQGVEVTDMPGGAKWKRGYKPIDEKTGAARESPAPVLVCK